METTSEMVEKLEEGKGVSVSVEDPKAEENAEEAPLEETSTEPSKETKAPSLKETPEFVNALREAQSGWDRKIALEKAEKQAATAEVESVKAELESTMQVLKTIQAEYREAVEKFTSDDPEARRAFVDRIAIAEERRKVAKEKADADRTFRAAALKEHASNMREKKQELIKDMGVPADELEGYETEMDMENAALRWKIAHPGVPERTDTPVNKNVPKKIDSGLNTGISGKLTKEQAEAMDMGSYAKHPEVIGRYK